MATGDQQDMQQRLKSLLPPSWFGTGLTTIDQQTGPIQTTGSDTPVLDTVLSGGAYNFAWIYVLAQYVLTQSRIMTATGVWLDRISYDFLGNRLPRLATETDDQYRIRILDEIMRARQTRAAIIKILQDLTGNTPKIIELWNPGDVGEYNVGPGCQGYGKSGMYGSLQYRNQVFVTAFRPSGQGIPGIAGYGDPQSGYGAFDHGEYAQISDVNGPVTDTAIYAAVAAIIAAGITAWVAIEDAPPITYYSAEDGLTLYVAEDGVTNYVTES